MAPVAGAAFRALEAVVDSGAEDSVTPPDLFPGGVTPSPMSREGRNGRTADGSHIPNFGQAVVCFKGAEGGHVGSPI